MAKLMKEFEAKHGSGELRVLSIDDYFLVEEDIDVETPTGKKLQKVTFNSEKRSLVHYFILSAIES